MSLHVIRLRGPWEYETISAQGDAVGLRGDLLIQSAWPRELAEAGCEIIRLSRRFHRPTGIEPGDRVWLRILGFTARVGVTFNRQGLETTGAPRTDEEMTRGSMWRCEVTPRLEVSNVLTIDVGEGAARTGRPIGEVTLEIESPGA